jgi:hypothetical protein
MEITATEPEMLYPHPPDMRNRPDFYLPSDELLDFLLDHQIDTAEHLKLLFDRKVARYLHERICCPGEWFDDLLPALQWWIDLSDMALDSRTTSEKCLEVNPEFAAQRAVFSEHLTGVMVAYMPAKRQISPYGDLTAYGPYDAIIELLRRYWTFVREVQAFARKVWSDYHRAPEPLNPLGLH